MSLRPAVSAHEPPAGTLFLAAVNDVKARLDAAAAATGPAGEDPLAYNALLNFRAAVNEFYDAFVRRHCLAATDEDDGDDDDDDDDDIDGPVDGWSEDEASLSCTLHTSDDDDDDDDDYVPASGASQDSSSGGARVTVFRYATEEEAKTQCTICGDAFNVGTKVHVMQCGHMFHSVCAQQWLRLNPVCPICRDPLK